jgi:hypothetical protein
MIMYTTAAISCSDFLLSDACKAMLMAAAATERGERPGATSR